MADSFVDVPIETDARTLADNAVARLEAQWLDWTPNEADLEVVQIEAIAPMAADSAQSAARMPRAAFRAFGTKLADTPYLEGSPAVTTSTFTLTDTLGHTIPLDTEIDVDGWAFVVTEERVVPPGSGVAAAVPVEAVEHTESANNLPGTVVTMISTLSDAATPVGFVDTVDIDAAPTGGTEPETDEQYEGRLTRTLRLQAKTLVTVRDFELFAIDTPGIGRALAFHDGERNVNVFVADDVGEPVAAPIKSALAAVYVEFRLVNTVTDVLDPTYTTISVSYIVKKYPGYDSTDLAARINAMLQSVLHPAEWGKQRVIGEDSLDQTTWIAEDRVRANKIIDLIGNVEGVDYVSSITITGNAGSASGADWVLAGAANTARLTRPGSMAATVI